ncbi:MAG: hypothetical protein KC501_31880 [Myxococcales bacterium]|nr:hypothetical protein [Myxococcales bacterium]
MRRQSPFLRPIHSFAFAAASVVTLCATTASAAQPAAPAPAPAQQTRTEVTAPAGTPVVVVNNTSNPTPAAAPAPAVIPVVAPVPAPVVATAPVPAPVPVPSGGHIAVDLYPQPMAGPSPAERRRLQLMAEQSRARSLRIAGWATLGGTYGFSALIGTISIDSTSPGDRMRGYGYSMVLPVAGPFIAAFHTRSATGALLTTSLGVAQAVGLGMALVGGHRYRRFKRDLSIAAAPTRGGGQIGVSMRF